MKILKFLGLLMLSAGVSIAQSIPAPAEASAAEVAAGTIGTKYVSPRRMSSAPLTTAQLNAAFGSTQGSILYRNASGWTQLTPGTSGQLLSTQGAAANPIWVTATGGAGDMNGPASATDNAIVRFDGTGGKTVQNSAVTIADTTGAMTWATGQAATLTGGDSGASLELGATASGVGTFNRGIATSGGVVATGTVDGMANIYRTDSSITVSRTTGHAMIDLYLNQTGTSGGEEAVVNFSAQDAGGTAQQLGSLSMIWARANAGSFASMWRLHGHTLAGAGGASAASSNSDLRGGSGIGIEAFGTSDTTWPGANVFQITNGSLKVTGGGVPGVASIFNNTNRLIFNCDTGGYLFQNATNTVALLSITNAGVAAFSGAMTAAALTATGTGTFGGSVGITHASGDSLTLSKSTGSSIVFNKSDATAQSWRMTGEGSRFVLGDATAGTNPFAIAASTGAASFTGAVTHTLGTYYPPQTAPSAPASGWVTYTDSGDGNKLKAKASTGTVVTLGTP